MNCCFFKMKKEQFSSYLIANGDEVVEPLDVAENTKLDEQFTDNNSNINNASNEPIGYIDDFDEDITKKDALLNYKCTPQDLEKEELIDSQLELENSNLIEKTTEPKQDCSEHTAEILVENDLIKPLPAAPQPVFYELKVNLKHGKNLAIRDRCGTSDPYAKFILNNKLVYKSKIIFKDLNPIWNEQFTLKLDPKSLLVNTLQTSGHSVTFEHMREINSVSTFTSESSAQNFQLEYFLSKFNLKMFVYDYDRGFLNDDLIGYHAIDLISLRENTETQVDLELVDDRIDKSEYLGLITLSLNLVPKFKEDDTQSISTVSTANTSNTTSTTNRKRGLNQAWHSVVNIVLVEANNLKAMDANGLSDPYVKIKMENEKYKSRIVKRSLNPRFLEQFQFYAYDPNKMILILQVYDQDDLGDDFIGKGQIDLKNYNFEKTHFVRVDLEDDAGSISFLVTITGMYYENDYVDASINKYKDDYYKLNKYNVSRLFHNMDDVGWLQVKVLKAESLASADINGKSDPFVCLQLVNQFRQTHTVYKSLNPEWNKAFEFNVNDIHAILEVTVLDEDSNKVYEFLGKVEIPILSIRNGERKFYVLKDRKLQRRAKGSIELEMFFTYNPIKAVIRTLNPKEDKLILPEPKLRIPELKYNIKRIHNIVQGMQKTGAFIESCFQWEDPVRSLIAFISFLLIASIFELYMLPFSLLMIFFKNYLISKFQTNNANDESQFSFDYGDEDEDEDSKNKETKSFRERLNEIQEICLKVQESLDFIASLAERVINTFNFTIPWLSCLAIIILLVASFILYIIPLRYLVLAYGINKFTKKFRKPPGYIDNIELLDFLSRVPSRREVCQYYPLKYEPNTNDSTAKTQRNTPGTKKLNEIKKKYNKK